MYTYIKKPLWLTPVYSEWVGAWWLVYALGTCLSLMLCLFLCIFDIGGRRHKYLTQRDRQAAATATNPAYLLLAPSNVNEKDAPLNNRLLSSRTSSSTTNLSSTANVALAEFAGDEAVESVDAQNVKCSTTTPLIKLKDFLTDLLSLIKHLLVNLRFMGITCCAIVEALLIKGYLAFLSKHIEYQFRTTSSHSSVYIGVISLFSVSEVDSPAMSRARLSPAGDLRHAPGRLLRQAIRHERTAVREVLLHNSRYLLCDLPRTHAALP